MPERIVGKRVAYHPMGVASHRMVRFTGTNHTDAQTVELSLVDGDGEVPMMKAMDKGNGTWLVMYNPEFYPKPA
jgi:hypothetical protein